MKQKGIPKEKLTMGNIRSDLREKLWKSWLLLAVELVISVGLGYLTLQDPSLLFFKSGRWDLPGWFYILVDPLLIALLAREAWRLYTGYRKQPIVVKDTLVSSEGEASHSTHTYRTYYCTLRFARYGEYSVPEKNHRWSEMYPLSCEGEYNYAVNGDEYYLVLSKPHNGKILLAYNAKLFELESEKVEEIS